MRTPDGSLQRPAKRRAAGGAHGGRFRAAGCRPARGFFLGGFDDAAGQDTFGSFFVRVRGSSSFSFSLPNLTCPSRSSRALSRSSRWPGFKNILPSTEASILPMCWKKPRNAAAVPCLLFLIGVALFCPFSASLLRSPQTLISRVATIH